MINLTELEILKRMQRIRDGLDMDSGVLLFEGPLFAVGLLKLK